MGIGPAALVYLGVTALLGQEACGARSLATQPFTTQHLFAVDAARLYRMARLAG